MHWKMYALVVLTSLSASFTSVEASADQASPFWTEKSSYIEGEYFYAVGVAQGAETIDAGREAAFKNGKQEMSNYLQVTDISELNIYTQMTYEKKNKDGSFNVYRLLRVPHKQMLKLKDKLNRKASASYQEFIKKQEQEISQKQAAVKEIEANNSRLNEIEQKYQRIASRVNQESEEVKKYIKKGMTRREVQNLLGRPASTVMEPQDGWAYGKYWVIFYANIVSCVQEDIHTLCK